MAEKSAVVVEITPEERIELEIIVTDRDGDQALRFIQKLLRRVKESERHRMRSPLDN